MKLQEFVTETLTQIIGGVQDAQTKVGESSIDKTQAGRVNPPLSTSAGVLEQKGYRVDVDNRPVQNVEFDVAVSVDETLEAKGEAGLFVAATGLGAKVGTNTKDTTVHRIKFAVPITLPMERG